jgi:hypothetical protein
LEREAALTPAAIAAIVEVRTSRVAQVAATGLRRRRSWTNYLDLRPRRPATGQAGGLLPFVAGWPSTPSRLVP